MQWGDVGMIMAVQEAIESDEGEQDEPGPQTGERGSLG